MVVEVCLTLSKSQALRHDGKWDEYITETGPADHCSALLDGLSENGSHRFRCSSAWSTGGGTGWRSLEGAALLEEWGCWGRLWE